MKPDITYINSGIFITFLPNTQEGEKVWRQMYDDECDKVLKPHAPQIIARLKAAGYSVRKGQHSTREIPARDLRGLGI